MLPRPLYLMSLLVLSTSAVANPPAGDPAMSLRTLSSQKIFFGHHSVGANILDGIRDLSSETSTPLPIVTGGTEALGEGGILHAPVGQNEKPLTKLQAFQQVVDGGVGAKVDVAFFKFCYIDFHAETDVQALFDAYVKTLSDLQARHREVTFVHVTVPLTVTQGGIKGYLKNLLGSGAWGERENARRHAFNELLRARYVGKEPLFDLATVESTAADGRLHTYKRDDKLYPSLVPAFTDDGEHLNATGRKRVARSLLTFLSGLPSR